VYFLLVWISPVPLILFIIASITDWADGFIARKFNMVTDLGKFLDPLADKILVISALICFIQLGYHNITWMVIVIVTREFVVTGFRLAVVSKDNTAVIAADIWGKIKTAATMLVIIWILFMDMLTLEHGLLVHRMSWFGMFGYEFFIPNVLMLIVTILTVFSGVTMICKNRKLFNERDKNG
jgi:CDP-diacylglycerol--glycerol-3-phosphate 3-phosphatidyltransferase